jgi:DNA-binding NarL/FixJ family response regulator
MLVDGSTLLRRCLALVLGRKKRLEVVAEATSGEQALAEAASAQPEVIVVDPDVPQGGPRLVADLRDSVPECALIVLTASVDGAVARRALEAGALACLQKDCEPETLVDAIDRAHRGEFTMAPGLARAMVEDRPGSHSRATGPESPTARELEVLDLVAKGHTNQGIARELVITEHTVKSHLAKLMGKLGLRNRAQLATYATQHEMASSASSH